MITPTNPPSPQNRPYPILTLVDLSQNLDMHIQDRQ